MKQAANLVTPEYYRLRRTTNTGQECMGVRSVTVSLAPACHSVK